MRYTGVQEIPIVTARIPPHLRMARREDVREIANLSRCLIELGLRGWAWHPTRVARALMQRETCALVAEIDGTLAGFAIAEFGDARVHLSLLAVKPAHQRRGLGSTLIEWIETSALTAGLDHVVAELRVNNFAARSFYESLGFRQTRFIPGYYQGTEAAVRMQHDIRVTPAQQQPYRIP